MTDSDEDENKDQCGVNACMQEEEEEEEEAEEEEEEASLATRGSCGCAADLF